MAYYKLADRCMFIDFKNEQNHKLPSNAGTSCGLIIDKRPPGPFQEYPLTDEGAFIMRFMQQGVDSSLISQMFASEYNMLLIDAETEIKNFIAQLLGKQLVKTYTYSGSTKVNPAQVLTPVQFKGFTHNLDVGQNQFGNWWFKG
jgi:hypothetical protein